MIMPKLILNIERWKFNSEYGVYVSNLGHFKDRHKRNISYRIGKNGYCRIPVEGNKLLFAHRLVLLTWRPIPDRESMTVDHINHNKRDNSLANLEWVTYEENQRRANADYLGAEGEAEFDATMKPEVKVTKSAPVPKDYNKFRFDINGILLDYNALCRLYPREQFPALYEKAANIIKQDHSDFGFKAHGIKCVVRRCEVKN